MEQPESYIGKTLDVAKQQAETNNVRYRTISVDGEARVVTADYQPDRLNFTVVDGMVTGVRLG